MDPAVELLESFQNKCSLEFWPTAQFDHDQIPSYLLLLNVYATSLFARYYCSGIVILYAITMFAFTCGNILISEIKYKLVIMLGAYFVLFTLLVSRSLSCLIVQQSVLFLGNLLHTLNN